MWKKTEENLNKMRQLYEEGKSIEEIAEETGYKQSSVKAMLPRAGVQRTKRIEPYIPTMVAMRKNGISVKEIAEEIGFNATYVSKVLCKAGCRTVEKNRAPHEPVIDESRLVFADNTVKISQVIVAGKKYLDVTALFT